MMAVGAFELLGGHAEEAGRLPEVRACLHLPSSGGVAQHMRGHIWHAAIVRVAAEGLVHVTHGFAVPFDAKALPTAFPASQMSQKLWWQWDRRPSF
jgi:hypothetical protein